MGCIVKNQRLQDVLDLISALVADSKSGITTYDDVVNYFSKNFPEISQEEIDQALIPVDDIKRDDITKTLKNTKDRLRTLQSSVNRLNDVLENNQKNKTKAPSVKEANEIAKLIRDIRNLAGTDIKIPPEAYGDIVSRLENLGVLQDAYFQTTGPISESHIKRAIDNLRQIKRNAKIDEIDAKISDIDNQINKLNDGSITLEEIENLDTPIRFKELDREIAAKELALQEKRVEFDVALRKARIKERAKTGILGFDGKVGRTTAELAYTFKESIWEPFRALKFMADISAWGVQAAPVVYNMMLNVDVKRAMEEGKISAAFTDQAALGKTFYDTTARVIWDGAKKSSKYYQRSNSTLAQELLNDIKADPSYVMAKKAKLQISEAGSLSRSEEVFTSNVINKIPLMGAVKDISEDTMVSTLNALRMIKFKKFYDATNGSASLDEYQKVAELINQMTGTSMDYGQVAGVLSYILSAPKLLMSRIMLMTKTPLTIIGNLDMKRSSGSIFRSEADRFIATEYSKMLAGYAVATFLVSLLPGIDFEEDPTESNFLRYRSDDLAIDATGGIGTMARTIMKAYMLAVGVPEGASYTTKNKINYIENVRKQDGLDALMTGFIRYKLHPTISAAYQFITVEDFFGERYRLLGKDGIGPRTEATIRAFLPISFEQAVDDVVHLYEDGVRFNNILDPKSRQEIGKVMTSSTLQAIGMNTFRYDNAMANIKVIEFENDVEHRARPEYPSYLQKADGDTTKEYFRDKYRKIWGDILGEMVLSRGADASKLTKEQYKALNKQAIKQTNVEFQVKYGDAFRSELKERGRK